MKKMIRTLLTVATLALFSVSTHAQVNEVPFNVPDGGATAGLLALGIGAIAVMRRNRK
jgi:hypothetical protein